MIDHGFDNGLESCSHSVALSDPYETLCSVREQIKLASVGHIGKVEAGSRRNKRVSGVEILVGGEVQGMWTLLGVRSDRSNCYRANKRQHEAGRLIAASGTRSGLRAPIPRLP
jgi:hypothetical protein